MDNARRYTNRLLEMVDEGLLDSKTLLENSLLWLSEDAVKGLVQRLELERMCFPPMCPFCRLQVSDADDDIEHSDGVYHSDCYHDMKHEEAVAASEDRQREFEEGPSAEQEAREAFNDKLAMYRNEY
jgi:hypothetical protein